MLALATHQGWPIEGYVQPDHPVQQAIRHCIEECCDTSLAGVPIAPDGCTAPTWAMPLHRLALGFARFADPQRLPEPYRDGAKRLYNAVVKHPFFVAGTDRYCTEVMAALGDKVFLKVGAEGVYIAAIPSLKLGVAIKMDSGSAPAAEVVMSAILMKLGLEVPAKWQAPEILNRNDIRTGHMCPVTGAFEGIASVHGR